MELTTARKMLELDRAAIEDEGIPSTLLMERAGAAVAAAARALLGERRGGRAAVFCGAGNNGGDGVCAARLLRQAGLDVRAFFIGSRPRQSGDSREMERRLMETGGMLEDFAPDDPALRAWCAEADVMVDALFGIGLRRPPEGAARAAVRLMNAAAAPVVSADIASGVETDTGCVLGESVRADITVTFTRAKIGHFAGDGALCTGELRVAEIGIPAGLTEGMECDTWAVTEEDVAAWLPRRRRDAHKGDFGRVHIIAGSVGYTGAPVLAARGAVRMGSGLVHLSVPAPIYEITAVKCDEAMPAPFPAAEGGTFSAEAGEALLRRMGGGNAALIGPGLGRSPDLTKLVETLIGGADCPLVLDADGINAVSDNIYMLQNAAYPPVLTPHEGEFRRLGGETAEGDRLGAARAFAAAHRCVLVRKGHRTVTALPDGRVYLNTTGNPGMAKGGSGDVLAGMILSLLGQGLPPERAVPAAVWLHGRAGDLCAGRLGEYAMTPTDLTDALAEVLVRLSR